MMSKITIRDVAEKAGVSISTVHQALNGKKGVSEENRKRIQGIAADLGYQPNPMASSLKRKAKRICISFPNSQYYTTVWRGARDYLSSVPNMNLEWKELPYGDTLSAEENRNLLLTVLEQTDFDGILIAGHADFLTRKDWNGLVEKNTAVSLVGSDMPASGRIFCVMPDYDVIGRTMAELVLSRIPFFGSIAICAGNPKWEPHARVVKGFQSYMQETGARNRVYYNNSWDERDDSYVDILEMISRPDVAACCSVLSQSSILLGQALIESRKAGTLFAVGSDLSEKNISCLRNGIFHNLIQKNPYAQGYLGAKNLAEYLMLGRQPETDIAYVGSEVVFRSNISMYQDTSYRSLLR